MINTGLVSVTFRQLAPKTIVDLVRHAGLDAIEWGGDVHVPHGEDLTAHAVRQLTLDAGLRIPSYGAYYRVGHPDTVSFHTVIETAITLGASVIRVWAGTRGSDNADEAYWRQVIDDSKRIANDADQVGLVVAYEFHDNTLTDTYDSALRLLREVDHQAVKTYWQPPALPVEENVAGLEALIPWLANVHVTSTQPAPEGGAARVPLAQTADAWRRYFEVIVKSAPDHYALLEFVRDDTPEQFLEDAAVLKSWTEPYKSDSLLVI